MRRAHTQSTSQFCILSKSLRFVYAQDEEKFQKKAADAGAPVAMLHV
jgi:hypothetical protein